MPYPVARIQRGIGGAEKNSPAGSATSRLAPPTQQRPAGRSAHSDEMRESEGKSAGRSVRLTGAPVNAELPRFLAGSQAGALPGREARVRSGAVRFTPRSLSLGGNEKCPPGYDWFSGDLCCCSASRFVVPPSPPAKKKKTNARQDQAEHPITVPSGNGRVETQRVTRCRCKRQHIREHAQSQTLHDSLLSGYAA